MRRSPVSAAAAALIALAGVASIPETGGQPAPQTIAVNGTELSYVSQGTGTPVVFVHGAIVDHLYWGPQRAAFAERFRFVSFSQRYHGTGKWPDEGGRYSADTHAADLAALIKALKAGPVHLVGLSYGGTVAALMATKEPLLLRTLTLAEPAIFALLADRAEDQAALAEWQKGAAEIAASVKAGDTTTAARQLIAAVTGGGADAFDTLEPWLQRALMDNSRTLPLLFSAPPAQITCDTLRGIKVPTLLVHGERTPRFFSQTNAAVARCIAGTQAVAIPNASHAMSADNPAAFNRAVLTFIARHTPPSP